MVVEYIRYQLTAHQPQQLIDAYANAADSMDAAPECLGYELSQCADDPNSLILRIDWTDIDGHMQGFRKGPHFGPFLQEIRPFIPEITEMRHYARTAVRSTDNQ